MSKLLHTNQIRWKEDFPVPSDEDSYVTRRELTKFLGMTSLAFLLGTIAVAARKLWRARAVETAVPVVPVDELAVGAHKLFRYPTENDACILLRLEQEKFVAFNQRCTHLACPVYFEGASKRLVCPCHKGFFSAEDGRPLAGPPKRPLESLTVSVRDNKVWVKAYSEVKGT